MKKTRPKPTARGARAATIPPVPQPARARWSWIVPFIALVIIAAGVWAHEPGLDGVFLLDDVRAIARNQTIRTLWPLATPLSPPTASTVAGRPVANLTFAVNYALAPSEVRDVFETGLPGSPPDAPDRLRRNARGYHLGNLLIHLAAALVLFGIVRRTLLTSRLGPVFGHSAPWLAGSVALLWVVHPLTTASVTYLVQRVESLMSLFLLLTLYAAIRWSRATRGRPAWTALAVASCALGMGTKEAMVGAPLVVAAWLWIFGREEPHGQGVTPLVARGPQGRSRGAVILVAGLAATWVILALLVYGERRGPSLGLEAPLAWRYLVTQAEVIAHYLGQAFVPTSLVVLYDWPMAESLADAWPAFLMISVLATLTVLGLARRWPAAFPGVCFFVVLAPSSSVLPIVTEVAAEHRMYLPLAAVVTAVVVGVFCATRAIGGRPRLSRHAVAAGAAGLIVVLAAAGTLGTLTRARGAQYVNDETLWQDTVAKRPEDPRPRVFYGSVLLRRGKPAEAEIQLQAAVRLAPEDPRARLRLGSALAQQGKLQDAIPHLERAVANQPDDPGAHRMLGEIYAAQGREALAVEHLTQALRGMADDPQLLVRLAVMLADARDPSVRDGARALTLAERAVLLTSRRDVMALSALALASGEVGRFTEAATAAREALALARAQQANPALIRELEYRERFYTR